MGQSTTFTETSSIHLYKKNGCISVNVHVGKITTRTQVFWSRKSWRGSCGERIILRCFWCSRIVLLSFLGLKPRCSNVITLGFLVCFLFKFPLTLLSGFLFSGGATCSVSGQPKNAEKLIKAKAKPFTLDSITSLDFLPDFQHLLNSMKVEKRKAPSVKCLLVLFMMSLIVSSCLEMSLRFFHSYTTRPHRRILCYFGKIVNNLRNCEQSYRVSRSMWLEEWGCYRNILGL